MRLIAAAAAFAVALSAVAAPAAARSRRAVQPPVYDDEGFVAPARGGFYCQKMCPSDVTPCDPPEFKHADGRCSNPTPGLSR